MTRETDYFKSFCKISKAFGTAAGREELLGLIVENAITSMDGKAACLFLEDKRQDRFVVVAQAGLSDSYLHANPLKAAKLVAALDEKGYLAFLDATSDPKLENHEAKKKEGIASILTVLIKVKDRNIGILSLYTATRREFSPEEIEFLCALAEQGGLAIENNRLHRRMQRNAMLFLDLASSINSSLDINQILNYMTVNISEKLGMKGAVLRLLDDERNELKLVASHGLSDEFLKRVRTTSTETSRRALNGETLVVSDSTTDASITHRKSMKDEGVVAMIVTPLMARDKVIGVLRLYSDVPREFPEDVILMVKALAHQGGLAIQNASMYLQLQADKKSLEEDIWSYRSWF